MSPPGPLCEATYLQLPGGHLEGQLGDAARGPAGCVGGVQLVPDGIAVHLQARERSDGDRDRALTDDASAGEPTLSASHPARARG